MYKFDTFFFFIYLFMEIIKYLDESDNLVEPLTHN